MTMTFNWWEWATDTGRRMGQQQQCHGMGYFCSICYHGIAELFVAMQQLIGGNREKEEVQENSDAGLEAAALWHVAAALHQLFLLWHSSQVLPTAS